MAGAKEHGVERLNLHLFADGKDSPPQSIIKLIKKIEAFIKLYGIGTIASISGRFYALDRDEHWDRIQKTYHALTGNGTPVANVEEKIQTYYAKGLNDPFIEPFIIGPEAHPISDNDAVVFFDFREDSIRQIANVFIEKDFAMFRRVLPKNLYIATMTRYSDEFDVPVISPSENIETPLGKVLSDNDYVQLRVAETEKQAHVTYFFNGYQRNPFPNEYRVIIPSQKIASYAEAPEMRTQEISSRIIEGITEGGFDFILANFAGADMVAHTGDFDATTKAVTVIDREVKKILDACLQSGATLAITADHGNAEQLMNPLSGSPETKHNPSLVPFYLAGKGFIRKKSASEVNAIETEAIGILSDIAPTVLEILNIQKPENMTGTSLLSRLR